MRPTGNCGAKRATATRAVSPTVRTTAAIQAVGGGRSSRRLGGSDGRRQSPLGRVAVCEGCVQGVARVAAVRDDAWPPPLDGCARSRRAEVLADGLVWQAAIVLPEDQRARSA
jgi:hypothetical protein